MKRYFYKVADWTLQLLLHCMKSSNKVVKFIAWVAFLSVCGDIVLAVVGLISALYLLIATNF